MADYIKKGERMKLVLTADTVGGTPILVGDKVVVTCVSGLNEEEVECYTEGVFEFAANGAIAQGKNVKFNNTTKEMSVAAVAVLETSIADPIHGWAVEAAADNKVKVKIG